jgi:hypothetical protein
MSGLTNAHRSSSRENLPYHHRPSLKLGGEVSFRAIYDETAHVQQGILGQICPDLGTHTAVSPGRLCRMALENSWLWISIQL